MPYQPYEFMYLNHESIEACFGVTWQRVVLSMYYAGWRRSVSISRESQEFAARLNYYNSRGRDIDDMEYIKYCGISIA